MSEYLTFREVPAVERKTKIVEVRSALHGDLLGEIRWFGRWRRYAFFPLVGTVWDLDCLDSVGYQIRAMVQEREKAKIRRLSQDEKLPEDIVRRFAMTTDIPHMGKKEEGT